MKAKIFIILLLIKIFTFAQVEKSEIHIERKSVKNMTYNEENIMLSNNLSLKDLDAGMYVIQLTSGRADELEGILKFILLSENENTSSISIYPSGLDTLNQLMIDYEVKGVIEVARVIYNSSGDKMIKVRKVSNNISQKNSDLIEIKESDFLILKKLYDGDIKFRQRNENNIVIVADSTIIELLDNYSISFRLIKEINDVISNINTNDLILKNVRMSEEDSNLESFLVTTYGNQTWYHSDNVDFDASSYTNGVKVADWSTAEGYAICKYPPCEMHIFCWIDIAYVILKT